MTLNFLTSSNVAKFEKLIKQEKRNKLATERTEKLVSI